MGFLYLVFGLVCLLCVVFLIRIIGAYETGKLKAGPARFLVVNVWAAAGACFAMLYVIVEAAQ